MKKLLFIFTLLPMVSHAQTNIIYTVAGDSLTYCGSDDSLATLVGLKAPYGVAIDKHHNFYFSDGRCEKIRKVSATDSMITTYAGNGSAGFSGDGASALAAQLKDPIGISIDAMGNMYVADFLSNRIRKIDTAGIITTVAGGDTSVTSGSADGGMADTTNLRGPYYALPDNAGNLYITELTNNKVRKVNAAGIISTYAGSGTSGFAGDSGLATSASLNHPAGLALDRYGNLYISDRNNNRIRKVDTTGIITTIAGIAGAGGYGGDGGPATAAQLNQPLGIAFDSVGRLYIADNGNYRIRMIDTTGIITTVAGNGVGAGTTLTHLFSGDGGPADSAEIYSPYWVAVDTGHNFYFTDYGNARVRWVGDTTRPVVDTGTDTTIDTTSGVRTLVMSKDVTIFPNPTRHSITVSSQSTITRIAIVNLVGQTVQMNNYSAKKAEVNMEQLPGGMYFVKVNDTYIYKVLKE